MSLMHYTRKTIIRKTARLMLAGICTWLIMCILSSLYIVKSNHQSIPDIRQIQNHCVENWTILNSENRKISAWFIRDNPDKVVILLAGIKGNRLSQTSRAELYLKKGFSVLMPDLRGTGASEGEIISFGWNESDDLLACVSALKKKGFHKIGVHGQSMGAATIAYSLKRVNDYSFIIMESCYDSIENAFKNRIAKYHLPYILFIPVKYFTQIIINTKIDNLTPSEYIKNATIPALFLAGDSENQLKMSETLLIYKNCRSKNKTLHIFKGGKHIDFLKAYPQEYRKVWSDFTDTL